MFQYIPNDCVAFSIFFARDESKDDAKPTNWVAWYLRHFFLGGTVDGSEIRRSPPGMVLKNPVNDGINYSYI